MAAAGGEGDGEGAGEFTSAWTLAEAASRDPFHLGQFFALLWENTSGYLLAACLVSLLAALLSWVYVARAASQAGPDHRRTRTGLRSDRAVKDPTRTRPSHSDSDSDSDSRRGPPPPPPVEEDEEDCGSSEERHGAVPDLVEMAHHLPARVKQAELRHIREKLQGDMTEEQRRAEREVERNQMAAILELMQQNSDKFGKPSLDDMQAQLKLYM